MKEDKTAKSKIAARSSRIEEQILETQRRKEERMFLEELAKRVTIAKEGKDLVERGNYPDAMGKFRRFLSLTSRSLGVEVEGLRPDLFDPKVKEKECLLISAILLDLMKVLDKINNDAARTERAMYHRLFVRFVVGQRFQGFAAENLRKYILYGKGIIHKKEFWATYHLIRVKRICFVATWAYGSMNDPAVETLRNFRDQKLAQNSAGRLFIKTYYRYGSSLARLLDKIPGAQPIVKKALNQFVKMISE